MPPMTKDIIEKTYILPKTDTTMYSQEQVDEIIASTQEERDRSWRIKVDSVIVKIQKEFANTPLNERTNAFEWLQRAKSEILSDTKTNEK